MGALFTLDGPPLQLCLVAGVKPGQLLLAKLLGAISYVPIVGLSGWVASAGWTPGLVGVAAGQLLVMVGLGAAGARIGAEEAAMPQEMGFLLDQAPHGPWGWAGWAVAFLYGGAGVLGLAASGPAWMLAGLLVVVPLLTLALGLSRLRRLVSRGIG